MTTEPIKAIHSQDMKTYLASLGVLENVLKGISRCAICEKPVTLETIACLYPENTQVMFVCDNASCVESLMKIRGTTDA